MANGKWCDVIDKDNRHAVSYEIMKLWYMYAFMWQHGFRFTVCYIYHFGQPFWNWLSLFTILYGNQLFSLYSVLFLNYCSPVPCMLIVLLTLSGTATRVYRYAYNYIHTAASLAISHHLPHLFVRTFTLSIPLSTQDVITSLSVSLTPLYMTEPPYKDLDTQVHKVHIIWFSAALYIIYVILHCICTYAYPLYKHVQYVCLFKHIHYLECVYI